MFHKIEKFIAEMNTSSANYHSRSKQYSNKNADGQGYDSGATEGLVKKKKFRARGSRGRGSAKKHAARMLAKQREQRVQQQVTNTNGNSNYINNNAPNRSNSAVYPQVSTVSTMYSVPTPVPANLSHYEMRTRSIPHPLPPSGHPPTAKSIHFPYASSYNNVSPHWQQPSHHSILPPPSAAIVNMQAPTPIQSNTSILPPVIDHPRPRLDTGTTFVSLGSNEGANTLAEGVNFEFGPILPSLSTDSESQFSSTNDGNGNDRNNVNASYRLKIPPPLQIITSDEDDKVRKERDYDNRSLFDVSPRSFLMGGGSKRLRP